jgi:hypothetical protein
MIEIEQKPITKNLRNEGDYVTVPSDEVWYVSMVGDSNINISLTGNTTTGEYNYGSRRVGKPNQEPFLVPGGSTITVTYLNSGSDRIRISGWEVSDIVGNNIVAHNLFHDEYVDVPDNEVWQVRFVGREAHADVGPPDVIDSSHYSHSFRTEGASASGPQIVTGGERIFCSWTKNDGSDKLYISGTVVNRDYTEA